MTAPALEHYPRYGTFVWMDERLVRVDTTVLVELLVTAQIRDRALAVAEAIGKGYATVEDLKTIGIDAAAVTLEPKFPGSAVFVDKSPQKTFEAP